MFQEIATRRDAEIIGGTKYGVTEPLEFLSGHRLRWGGGARGRASYREILPRDTFSSLQVSSRGI